MQQWRSLTKLGHPFLLYQDKAVVTMAAQYLYVQGAKWLPIHCNINSVSYAYEIMQVCVCVCKHMVYKHWCVCVCVCVSDRSMIYDSN